MKKIKKTYSELVKELANAKKTIEEQKKKISESAAQEIIWPLRLYMALEAVLKKDFSAASTVRLQLLNHFKESETIEFNAEEVICIVPVAKGRKKYIYLLQNNLVKVYTLNNNSLNFDNLIQMIDPLNKFLLKISKSAVINVKYYELKENRTLLLSIKQQGLAPVRYVQMPDFKTTLISYLKIRNSIEYNLSLQKRVLGYISEKVNNH